jgi:hypothetical protein
MVVRHSLVTVRSQVQEGMLINNINFAQSASWWYVIQYFTVRSQVQEGMLIHNINSAQSTT